jgi:hypothetical protein
MTQAISETIIPYCIWHLYTRDHPVLYVSCHPHNVTRTKPIATRFTEWWMNDDKSANGEYRSYCIVQQVFIRGLMKHWANVHMVWIMHWLFAYINPSGSAPNGGSTWHCTMAVWVTNIMYFKCRIMMWLAIQTRHLVPLVVQDTLDGSLEETSTSKLQTLCFQVVIEFASVASSDTSVGSQAS